MSVSQFSSSVFGSKTARRNRNKLFIFFHESRSAGSGSRWHLPCLAGSCESRHRRGKLRNELYTAEEQNVAKRILEYLQKNPQAKDTMTGIHWWLWGPISMKIERAVSFLLAAGLLVETKRKGLPPYFRLNPDKTDEITKLLRNNTYLPKER